MSRLSDHKLYPAIIRLLDSIPQVYKNPHQQLSYEQGYLIALVNSLYDQCPDVRTLIKHKLTAMKEPNPENSRDAW